VRIPVKAATLYHLKLGHYFLQRPSLGHYAVAPDQTGRNCFLATHGPSDFCHVTGGKGFIRLALEQGVPIVPIVAGGGQETRCF
jgi:hypothetical protein